MGLQPKPMHYIVICPSKVLQKFEAKRLVDKSSSNVVRTHTQAHPQHMKVLKLLLCVWYWCGGPLEWVYSLKNQCTMTMTMLWFAPFLGGNQNSRKIWNAWLTWAMVTTHIYAHPQQMKVVNHIICVWYWCWEPIWMGLQHQLPNYCVLPWGGKAQKSRQLPVAWRMWAQ